MIVLYDVNVLMDFLDAREPFDREASAAWAIAEEKQVTAYVSSLSISTVFYLSRRRFDRIIAEAAVEKVVSVFKIAAVDSEVIFSAMNSGMTDFEDAIQSYAGLKVNASHVVTRDATGFKESPLHSVTPGEFLAEMRRRLESGANG